MVLAMLPVGFAFGALEVSIRRSPTPRATAELAGVLIACGRSAARSAGSSTARARGWSLLQIHLRAALVLPIGIALILLASSPL